MSSSGDAGASSVASGPLTIDEAYVVLEVPDEHRGDLDRVKTAYRKLCLRWHPDKNPPEKEAECKARFTRVTAAYHTITTNNFDYQRWARSYEIPPMQTLEDVLKMALSGRDPFEIEAVLRARGDYRPNARFGVDVNVPWSAGERHDPTFDVETGSGYRTTRAVADAARHREIAWREQKVVGTSAARPWETVGGVGFEHLRLHDKTLAIDDAEPEGMRPDLTSDHPDAAAAAERLNDAGVRAFGEKRYAVAYKAYSECLRLRPDTVPYLGNRAAAGLKMRGKERDVVKDCERAVELDPGYARGWTRMGQALLALGDRDDEGDVVALRGAKRALERALELEPGNKTAAKTLKEVGMSLQLYDDSDDDQ